MSLYRINFREMAQILETKDIAEIHYSLNLIDLITDDGTEYVFRYKSYRTFKRVFGRLLNASIYIDMHKVLSYYLGGLTYEWREIAPALIKSSEWLDFLCNLNPQKYIRYEAQNI